MQSWLALNGFFETPSPLLYILQGPQTAFWLQIREQKHLEPL